MTYDKDTPSGVKTFPGKDGAEVKQEGGNHYKGMKVEPLRFAMENDWDAAAFSILKHVSRHRSKAGLLDIKKARHYVDLRFEQWGAWLYPKRNRSGCITVEGYCNANGITGYERMVLRALEEWVNDHSRALTHMREMKTGLDALAREYKHVDAEESD